MKQAIQEMKYTAGNLARLDLENIERFGEYTRLYFEDRSFTNVEELRYAGRLARILEGYGVRQGDRVVVMLPNSPEFCAAFQACWMIGATIVPVIPQWTAGEVANILRGAEPIVALTLPPLAERLSQANSEVNTLKQILVFGPNEVPGTENIQKLIESVAPIETPIDSLPSDLAILLYTSGTTGLPKGVMITHENFAAAVESAFRQNPNLKGGPMLNPLPMTHVYGVLVQNVANRWGFSTVLMRQFEPGRALEAIERHKIIYLPVVPTMLMYMLQHPERERRDLSSLVRIISGGAALPEPLRRKTEAVFRCRVDQGYGLSESCSVATGYEIDRPYREGSAGVASPGVEIRILDDQNRPATARTAGEICLAGANVTPGYWRDPDATRELLKDGWLHTGDVGFLDQDGHLFITDRKKDLIIKGGENISPREIEEALYLHPAVAEVAVVGFPDPVYGEDICAVLQLKAGLVITEQDLQLHVAQYVTKFKIPRRMIFQPMLPKNLNGKILKYKIRAQLLSMLSGSV